MTNIPSNLSSYVESNSTKQQIIDSFSNYIIDSERVYTEKTAELMEMRHQLNASTEEVSELKLNLNQANQHIANLTQSQSTLSETAPISQHSAQQQTVPATPPHDQSETPVHCNETRRSSCSIIDEGSRIEFIMGIERSKGEREDKTERKENIKGD